MMTLDPLDAPSETHVRFVLLIVSAIVLVLSLATSIMWPVTAVNNSVLNDYGDSMKLQEFEALTELDRAAIITRFYERTVDAKIQVIAGSLFPPVALAVFLTSAYLVYRTAPSRLARRYRLTKLTPAIDAALYAEVTRLMEQSVPPPHPTVYLDAQPYRTDGQAFGRRGHYGIRLGRGTRLLYRRDADRFRALFRHELAHIANRDVERTYFTQALWTVIGIFLPILLIGGYVYNLLAFRMTPAYAVPPDAVPGTLEEMAPYMLPMVPRMIFSMTLPWTGLVLAVIALRASILRRREIYADLRVAQWGSGQILRAMLGQTPYARRGLRAIVALHPTTAQRVMYLDDPRRALDFSLGTSFSVGLILSWIVMGALILLINTWDSTRAFLDYTRGLEIAAQYGNTKPMWPSHHIVAAFADVVQWLLWILVLIGIPYLFNASVGVGLSVQAHARSGKTHIALMDVLKHTLVMAAGATLMPGVLLGLLGHTVGIMRGLALFGLVALVSGLMLIYTRVAIRAFTYPATGLSGLIATSRVAFPSTVVGVLVCFALVTGPVVGIMRAFTRATVMPALAGDPDVSAYQRSMAGVLRDNPTLSMRKASAQIPGASGLLQRMGSVFQQEMWSPVVMVIISLVAAALVLGISLYALRCIEQHSMSLDTDEGSKAQSHEPHEAFSTTSSARHTEQLDRAYTLRDRGKLHDALHICQDVLYLEPRNSEALNLQGTILDQLHLDDKALSAYSRALALQPNFAAARQNRDALEEARLIQPTVAQPFNPRKHATEGIILSILWRFIPSLQALLVFIGARILVCLLAVWVCQKLLPKPARSLVLPIALQVVLVGGNVLGLLVNNSQDTFVLVLFLLTTTAMILWSDAASCAMAVTVQTFYGFVYLPSMILTIGLTIGIIPLLVPLFEIAYAGFMIVSTLNATTLLLENHAQPMLSWRLRPSY